jgi:DNA polymerase-3 subunit gamma/tau
MSDYIVSARKYRPDSFETLIGQDTIARTLSNSIKRGQLAHAYLFCGPRGVGKTTTARIFAKMINCSNPGPDMEPCGECESCVSFKEGRSYCIHELDAASNNSVEDIKTLMDQVQVPPQVGKYSVYIIDEVHMLSTAAFNAFLKTLEEPPAHAIFILATTEKHKILPTILSRCQTYDFNRISIADMVRNLKTIAAKEGVTIDDKALHVIAEKADGAMRDALTIFDQSVAFCGTTVKYEDVIRNLGVLDYEYCFSMVDNFLSGNYGAALLSFDEILSKGFNALHFVASLSSHLRDLVVAKTGGLESLLELPDSLKQSYAQQAARCSVQFLFDALGITTQCESQYKAAVNPRLHIEYAIMRLSHLVAAFQDNKAAPAAAPAPEKPAPAPAETPAPRRRAAKTGSALSMNALMEEKKVEEKPAEAAPEVVKLPEDDAVRQQWKELSKIYADKPRLASTIANGKIEVREEGGVKIVDFVVKNDAQKQWIEDKLLRDLEGNLRKLLGTPKVNIEVAVVPEEETEKVPYMPEEKAKDLMDKNPDVRAFVLDLSLDTK